MVLVVQCDQSFSLTLEREQVHDNSDLSPKIMLSVIILDNKSVIMNLYPVTDFLVMRHMSFPLSNVLTR